MADYESGTGLEAIDVGGFLPGEDLDEAVLDQLRDQHNTMWGGAGSPLFSGRVNYSGAGSLTAKMELPPMPGLRAVQWSAIDYGAGGPTVTLADSAGTLATKAGLATWETVEFTAANDGGWLSLEVTDNEASRLGVAPAPFTASVTDMGGDGFIHTDRTATGQSISTGLMGKWLGGLWDTRHRPMVYVTRINLGGVRNAAGTTPYIAGFPVPSRGHRLGISVEGQGTAASAVRLLIGGEVVATCTGFPTSAPVAIVRANTTDPILPGHFQATVQIFVPSGAFYLHSLSVYEYPDAL